MRWMFPCERIPMDNHADAPLISSTMIHQPIFSFRGLMLTGAVLFGSLTISPALEPRTWISLDGRTLDAELIKTEGEIVELKDKEGRILKIPKLSLSFGDLDYIAEYAPQQKSGALGAKPPSNVRIPNPAKEMKFSNKTVKKEAGKLKLGGLTLGYCETPHFKVLYSKGIDPMDTAEQAERFWHDTAFFHGSFAGKFKDRRMALVLAEGVEDYKTITEWYGEILNGAGQTAAAKQILADMDKTGALGLNLPAEYAADNGLLTDATMIRIKMRGQTHGTEAKGVWDSFRCHILAQSMLGFQAGGQSSFAREGQFAIFTGYCYQKEIDLSGASVTVLIQKDTGKSSSTSASYDTGRNWAAELKRRLRKGDVKLNLTVLWGSSANDAKPDDFALAYSFSRFLQSTPARLTAYGKLMERVSTAKQVPDPDGVARIYGLNDAPALEKEWRAYVDSGDFR